MELDLFLVRNRVQVMQHVDGRRHQAAAIDVVLELTSEAVTRCSLAHFIEQLSVLVQEIQAFRIFLAGLVVKRKGLFAKAVLEQRADPLVAFRIVARVGFSDLLRGTHPGKSLFRCHQHAVRIRDILLGHQSVFHQLQAAAVRIVGQREIADTVEVGFAGKRILAELHVGIAQEHTGAASAPQERFLTRIDKGRHGFVPLFLLKVHKTDTELRPLSFYVVLKALMGERLVTDDRAVVIFLLFVFKALYPEVVRIFLAELARILQRGIHRADFLFVTAGIVPVQAQDGLHPQRSRFHGIQQELELLY